MANPDIKLIPCGRVYGIYGNKASRVVGCFWGLPQRGLLLVIGMRLDWRVFAATLGRLRYWWILAACLTSACSLMGRALRWKLISATGKADYRTFWQAVAMGGLGNLVLPARAGELVRMGVVQRLSGIPFARVAASAVADRMADMATLFFFAVSRLS